MSSIKIIHTPTLLSADGKVIHLSELVEIVYISHFSIIGLEKDNLHACQQIAEISHRGLFPIPVEVLQELHGKQFNHWGGSVDLEFQTTTPLNCCLSSHLVSNTWPFITQIKPSEVFGTNIYISAKPLLPHAIEVGKVAIKNRKSIGVNYIYSSLYQECLMKLRCHNVNNIQLKIDWELHRGDCIFTIYMSCPTLDPSQHVYFRDTCRQILGFNCDLLGNPYIKFRTIDTSKDLDSPEQLLYTDFLIDSTPLDTTGAWGTIYYAQKKYCCLHPAEKFAMKFFGYSCKEPTSQNIDHEIGCMMNLRGIEGVVQIEGIFLDSASGLLSSKNWGHSYPVIVMELIEGGDLFTKITELSTQAKVSEKYIASLFKRIIIAVKQIHLRRMIHRDLKPQNIMLSTTSENSQIKIIDFGLMEKLPGTKDKIKEKFNFLGTPGYFAPETITQKEYSSKSDIWQCGCILYNLLSASAPFPTDMEDDTLKKIVSGDFAPMMGVNWEGISSSAKDLVNKMLQPQPENRISIEDILKHNWINGGATVASRGIRYTMLCLGRIMNKFLVTEKLQESHDKRMNIVNNKQLELRNKLHDARFRDKLQKLWGYSFQYILQSVNHDSTSSETINKRAKIEKSHDLQDFVVIDEISYTDFCGIMNDFDLPELLNNDIFNLFCSNNRNTSSYKDILFALTSIRLWNFTIPTTVNFNASFYFKLFDYNNVDSFGEAEFVNGLKFILHFAMPRYSMKSEDSFVDVFKELISKDSPQSMNLEKFQGLFTAETRYIFTQNITRA